MQCQSVFKKAIKLGGAEQVNSPIAHRPVVNERIRPINLHSNVKRNARLALNEDVHREQALVMLPGYRNILATPQAQAFAQDSQNVCIYSPGTLC